MNPILAAESEVQLLIIGLASGSGVIALIVKYLLSTPERESKAYNQGIADERNNTEDVIKELKDRCEKLEKENVRYRNGLIRLVMEAKFTLAQKRDITRIFGFDSISQVLDSEAHKPE